MDPGLCVCCSARGSQQERAHLWYTQHFHHAVSSCIRKHFEATVRHCAGDVSHRQAVPQVWLVRTIPTQAVCSQTTRFSAHSHLTSVSTASMCTMHGTNKHRIDYWHSPVKLLRRPSNPLTVPCCLHMSCAGTGPAAQHRECSGRVSPQGLQ